LLFAVGRGDVFGQPEVYFDAVVGGLFGAAWWRGGGCRGAIGLAAALAFLARGAHGKIKEIGACDVMWGEEMEGCGRGVCERVWGFVEEEARVGEVGMMRS